MSEPYELSCPARWMQNSQAGWNQLEAGGGQVASGNPGGIETAESTRGRILGPCSPRRSSRGCREMLRVDGPWLAKTAPSPFPIPGTYPANLLFLRFPPHKLGKKRAG